MKIVMRLYVEGKRTNKAIDLKDYTEGQRDIDEYEIDPRYEWAELNGKGSDYQEILKISIDSVEHEWKLETESERGDALPDGWEWND